MCYIGYLNDDSSVAKMATEDIKVWQTMNKVGDCFLAPHRLWYVYPTVRLQTSNQLDVEIDSNKGKLVIYEGLHSYSSLYSYLNRIGNADEIVITECYIPKGSVYFTDGEECVSQNLIFDKSYNSKEYLEYYSCNTFKKFFKRKPKPIYIWNT